MAWALVKHWKNDEIMYHDQSKYSLRKRLILKEPVTRKNVKNLHDGDFVSVIYKHDYLKWIEDPITRKFSQQRVYEENVVTYKLKNLNVKKGAILNG